MAHLHSLSLSLWEEKNYQLSPFNHLLWVKKKSKGDIGKVFFFHVCYAIKVFNIHLFLLVNNHV